MIVEPSAPAIPAAPIRKPTASQRPILAALAGEEQTIPQLLEQLGQRSTRRPLERTLHRLAGYGWVAVRSRPAPDGKRQVQYWRLLPAGAGASGLRVTTKARVRSAERPPAPRRVPAAQREILDLLTEFSSLTTEQIGEYLSANITPRAVQLRLATLRERGWIEEIRIQPERGGGSRRAWKLLPAGGQALGQPELVPEAVPIHHLRPLLLPDDPAPPLHPKGEAILDLLGHWKSLTTEQLARHLWGQWPCPGIQAVLDDLEQRQYIQHHLLQPEQGERSPYYWQLLTGGARARGVVFGSQHRKRPAQAAIAHRGVLLELIRQVAAAGWSLISPHIARPSDPLVEDSPQAQRLTATILDHIGRDLAARLAAGESRQQLAEEIHQHQAGQIGAILPRYVNDWVAYQPADVTRTVLLIPHPPAAGLGFWQNKPDAARRPDDPPRRESRLERYRRLAAILPVIAVFPDRDTAAPYAPILEAGGFTWVLVDEITTRLNHLQRA